MRSRPRTSLPYWAEAKPPNGAPRRRKNGNVGTKLAFPRDSRSKGMSLIQASSHIMSHIMSFVSRSRITRSRISGVQVITARVATLGVRDLVRSLAMDQARHRDQRLNKSWPLFKTDRTVQLSLNG